MKVSSVIRKFTVLLALSTLALTVMNCSKKDGDDTPQAQIVGSWKFTNYFEKKGNDAEVDQFALLLFVIPCFKDIVLTFKSDGTVTGSIPASCKADVEDAIGDFSQAKYEVKDGKLIITEGDGSQSSINVSFSGKTMSWTDSETSGGVTTTSRLVLTKQ